MGSNIDNINKPKRNIYVVFTDDVKYNSFVQRFLKKGFWHTFILIEEESDWYVLDPAHNRFDFKRLEWGYGTRLPLKLFIENGLTIIKINDIKLSQNLSFYGINCLTCVSLVKYILGINCLAFTPWKLLKFLIKNKHAKYVLINELEIENGRKT